MKRILISFFLVILPVSFVFSKVKPASLENIERITASSEWEENFAAKALDQNPATRWESVHGQDPGWIEVKFKEQFLLSTMVIRWELAAAQKYKIEVSDDGKEWRTVELIENGLNNEEREIVFSKPVETRYFRIYGEERTTADNGYSIWDIILNPVLADETKRIQIISAEASSTGGAGGPEKAIDNDYNTRWESQHDIDPSWLVVELSQKTLISSINIRWENACAKEYKIQVSTDKSEWKDVAAVMDGQPGEKRLIDFKPVEAKYIRVFCEKRFHPWWGYSIFEIKAYK